MLHGQTQWRSLALQSERWRCRVPCHPSAQNGNVVDTLSWLRVLGTTETPQIDQRIRHQFHPVVALLDVLETEQQPLEFVLPRKRPLDSLP
jgi:hypothetical protein